MAGGDWPRVQRLVGIRMASNTIQGRGARRAVDLVSGIHRRVHHLPVYLSEGIGKLGRALGDVGAGRAGAFYVGLLAGESGLAESDDGTVGGGVRAAAVDRSVGAPASSGSATFGAAGVVWRGDAVLHHADFPDPVRPTMDHPWLGVGRNGAALVVPSGAASRGDGWWAWDYCAPHLRDWR